MDGFEIGLIVLGAFIGIGVIFAFGSSIQTAKLSVATVGFKILYYFLPYSLFLFAAMSDLIVQEIHFFPGALISTVLVILNHLLARATTGIAQDTDICGIPGLSRVGSNLVPQSILFVTSLMSYIAGYVLNRNQTLAYPLMGLAGGVSLIQLSVINQQCGADLYYFGTLPASMFAIAIGGLAGFAGYFVSKYVNVTSGADTAQNSVLGSKSPITGPPASKTPGVGTCSAPNDQDQFVCEAYKNGQLVTSTIVE